MFEKVIVRELTDADKTEVVTHFAWRHPDFPVNQGGSETCRERSNRLVGDTFADPNSQFWKASIEGRDESFAYIASTYYAGGPDSEALLSMWIGEATNKLLGKLDKALLDAAMESAKAKGIARMWFGTSQAHGDSAQSLTKNGFGICETSTVPDSVKSMIGDLVPFSKTVR